jgi:hypothetical protein
MGGLVMMTVPLGVAGGAQAATRSAQSAASVSPANCFGPHFELFENVSNTPALFTAPASGGYYGFSTVAKDTFCQALVFGSTIVTIFDTTAGFITGSCMALNSSNTQIYLHSPSGCGGTADYLAWKFIPIGATPTGYKIYELQSQYAAAGDPCVYDFNDVAAYAPCNSSSRADTFIFFPV